jgi:NAD-dependent SIR2 family protein deacetylase
MFPWQKTVQQQQKTPETALTVPDIDEQTKVELQLTTPGRLYTVLTGQPSPILLVGAGASVRSGIPLAEGVVEKAARWAYALETSRTPEDPRILRSDWLPWLRTKSWYQHQRSLADNYHASVEHLLQPRQNRKDFFLKLITPGIDPSAGYQKLCEFLHHGIIKTILTTNFDHLLPDATRMLRRPRHVTLIETPSDYTLFSTSPDYPQIIYLHGSVEHYTDHNILQEVQKLDESCVHARSSPAGPSANCDRILRWRAIRYGAFAPRLMPKKITTIDTAFIGGFSNPNMQFRR